MVLPEKVKGIVYTPEDDIGQVGVQIQGKKQKISHKRIKLLVKSEELYPADYDFSIIFDSVSNRKAKKSMSKHYNPTVQAVYEKEDI